MNGQSQGAKAGGRRRGRAVTGIVLLDKPSGLTSNQALRRVKQLFQARKAGHTGSLDPLASGLLPICLGEATKVSGYLLDAAKAYRVTARLGVRTDTGDTDGEVVERCEVPALGRDRLEDVLERFRGDIMQVPPMYSALKKDGKRLYKLARSGVEVEREARPVTIYRLTLVDQETDSLTLDVECSKGTYIRSLVQDIAEAAGTVACVAALRRTGAGPFSGDAMVSMEAVEARAASGLEALDELLIRPDAALVDWPSVELDAAGVEAIRHGQEVNAEGAGPAGLLRVYGPERAFVGIGECVAPGRVTPRRLLLP